jgi:hypothetical protein
MAEVTFMAEVKDYQQQPFRSLTSSPGRPAAIQPSTSANPSFKL